MQNLCFSALLASSALFVGAASATASAEDRPLLMAGQDHSVDAIEDAHRQPNPLAPAIEAAREKALSEALPNETGIDRSAYLELMEGVVDFFRRYQDEDGAVLDPFAGREIQYSSPAYAAAAAVLVSSGVREDLKDSAGAALEHSLTALARGEAVDKVGDFYIVPAMVAYRQLRPIIADEVGSRWDDLLKQIDPELAYSDRIGPGQPDVMNWNSSALTGEFLRSRTEFGEEDFVRRYAAAQLPRFTPEGLYRDPGHPMVYDAAARFNFLTLLEEGYDGAERDALEILLDRGAWVSLLMQSPNGDFPDGGRSSSHTWNDALQAATFELVATRLSRDGREDDARLFKRAARLSVESLRRWVRPSGEFWVVKNHFDPAMRHGFEGYSFHSQYNLLAAAYLAQAWLYADDDIGEAHTPAEVAPYAFHLERFGKVFANAGGRHLQLSTTRDGDANGIGILRTGVASEPERFRYLGNMQTQTPVWLEGLRWEASGGMRAVADAEEFDVEFEQIGASEGEVRFSVRYTDTSADEIAVAETYRVDPGSIDVTISLPDGATGWTVDVPTLVTDGSLGSPVRAAEEEEEPTSDTPTDAADRFEPAPSSRDTIGPMSDRNAVYAVERFTGEGNNFTYRLAQ